MMSPLKFVLDIGLQAIPGVGKALDAGLDIATTAAQLATYLYSDEEKPEDAFSWWLSPCGGMELVPDEIKIFFDILSTVADGVSSFKTPKTLKKGSGKKGDDGNPHDQSTPRSQKRTSNGQPKCAIPANKQVRQIRPGKNTVRKLSCDKNSKTQTDDEILVSAVFSNNPSKLVIKTACPASVGQACYYYQPVIKANPKFATLTCPPEAASTAWHYDGKATVSWSEQRKDDGWLRNGYYVRLQDQGNGCDCGEYPPAYLMNAHDPAIQNGGNNINGQMVRYLPAKMNSAGGRLWKGMCFQPLFKGLQMADLRSIVDKDKNKKTVVVQSKGKTITQTHATLTATERPEFQITAFPLCPHRHRTTRRRATVLRVIRAGTWRSRRRIQALRSLRGTHGIITSRARTTIKSRIRRGVMGLKGVWDTGACRSFFVTVEMSEVYQEYDFFAYLGIAEP
jgi:hypothetical protein